MDEDLRNEINAIKERNARVEADKAREMSLFRIVAIAVLTYFLLLLFMYVIGVEKPYLSAFVPTIGFALSTMSLRFAKTLWIDRFYKAHKEQ